MPSAAGELLVDLRNYAPFGIIAVGIDRRDGPNAAGSRPGAGTRMGRTQDIKKAYVRFAPGQTIDYEAKIKA